MCIAAVVSVGRMGRMNAIFGWILVLFCFGIEVVARVR